MHDTVKSQSRDGLRVTWIGLGANLVLALGKFLAGVFGHSSAMVADAAHSLSDLVSDAVVLVGLKLGRSEPDLRHPYGHGRIETLAAQVVAFILIIIAVYIGWEAVGRLTSGRAQYPNWLALAAAVVSIAVKEGLYRYTVAVGRRINSAAVVANAWHHRSDALSSIAVLVGVAGTLINPAWHSLDSWAALVVAALVAKAGVQILWGTIQEMIDTSPRQEVVGNIRACALGVPGVMEVHDLKVRSVGGRYQMQLHIVVDSRLSVVQGHDIAKEVEHCVLGDVKEAVEVVVHVDPAPFQPELPLS
ncbi:MAG: cation diffusion facilitator family transporter [Desulfarculaceae bacterium]|nr:cation diffusion facilitator family transporter [Desulfarculaceae bacterium]MCF8071608.1 cation diffusion facilitator family transporter [Desulfarculaceae bacterium]MCF8103195.1 cation diffusion facilitator family transporter [Desulfarculaceae bacterium]MCF8114887.1 cation diffusion facilitator family transporter [Desulfarculaceae bacterium]